MVQRKHSVELKLLHGVQEREMPRTVKAARREPKAPPDLSPAARKVWNHTVAELRDMGLLAAADLYEIEAYAKTVALANQLYAEIAKAKCLTWINPNTGIPHAHALLSSYDHALARAHASAKALGLTPYARTLIHGKAPAANNEASHLGDLYSA